MGDFCDLAFRISSSQNLSKFIERTGSTVDKFWWVLAEEAEARRKSYPYEPP